jgi:hypothetical protein
MEIALIEKEKIDSLLAGIEEMKAILRSREVEEVSKKWYPKKEAKSKLNVCMKTFDNYLSKGIIPYSRFAGKIYVKASDIEAHLERNYISK